MKELLMKISEAFPSKYLRASDLQGREVKLSMQHVQEEKIGNDLKVTVYFKGRDKALVLNKTNASAIADLYGDDTDQWLGKALTLFSVMVDFQGKVGPAIRVRAPRDNRITSGPQQLDDEIPF
jgi:hypothetical protein